MIRIYVIAATSAILASGMQVGRPALAAEAPCTQWDVSGGWYTIQFGQEQNAFLSLTQSGTTLSGSAQQHFIGTGVDVPAVSVAGQLRGASFEVEVRWNYRSVGVYQGSIDDTGLIEGTTYDQLSPNNKAKWSSAVRMNCLTRAALLPAPPAGGPQGPVVTQPDKFAQAGSALPRSGAGAAAVLIGPGLFAGDWDTVQAGGNAYRMHLELKFDGDKNYEVVGTLTPGNGKITGFAGIGGESNGQQVAVMYFKWDDEVGLNGTGVVALAPDGSTFAGRYAVRPTQESDLTNGSAWTGTRVGAPPRSGSAGAVQLPSSSGVLTKLPPPSPTNPLPPAPNGARSSALQKGPDSAILFAPGGNAGVPPTAPAAPAGPAGYAVSCLGGGAMSVSSGQDGFIRIGFTFAAQGSDAVAPRPGECAWHDRGFRQGEPAMLVYAASGKDANAVASAARNGDAFKVHAYNNNQGALIVTAVDGVTVANAPPPQTGGPTAFPPSSGTGIGLAVVTRAVNVRAGHSTADKVIGSLPAGTPVAVATCEGSWCRLALPFGANVGWVSKQFLQFAGSIGGLPVQ